MSRAAAIVFACTLGCSSVKRPTGTQPDLGSARGDPPTTGRADTRKDSGSAPGAPPATGNVEGLRAGDILELREDVFLLPCGGGMLASEDHRRLPFTMAEWKNAPQPKDLGGYGVYVEGVVPAGTRLVFEPEVRQNSSGETHFVPYARFVSGPVHGHDRVYILQLLYVHGPEASGRSRTDRYLIKVKED